MVSAFLLALATLSAPALAAPASAGYSPDTIRHMKGHPSLPVAREAKDSAAPAVCHPDPTKGRICRHHVAKQEAARGEALARAEVAAAEPSSAQ